VVNRGDQAGRHEADDDPVQPLHHGPLLALLGKPAALGLVSPSLDQKRRITFCFWADRREIPVVL
jgi:hypothetical protein